MLRSSYKRLVKGLRGIAGHRRIIDDGLTLRKREVVRLVCSIDPRTTIHRRLY